MKTIIAYTDGSAVASGKNKGRGGFGLYFPNLYGNEFKYSLGFEDTKTGRMELIALLSAIKVFNYSHTEDIRLKVYSDSQYVVKSFTESRLERWIKAGWQNSSGTVKNLDIWKSIKKNLDDRPFLKLEMNWIKGHQLDKEKNPVAKAYLMQDPHIVGNSMADKLADYNNQSKILKSDKL